MPSVDLYGGNHAVEIDGEAGHTALADCGIQLVVDLLQFFFQGCDVNIVCVVVFEYFQDLSFYIGVR